MAFNVRLADSLNVMYQDVVNKHLVAPITTRAYAEAENFVETYYPKLNVGVMEYLAAYMCVYPDGTICFAPADKNAVNLICSHNDRIKIVGYNDQGAIIRDEERVVSQNKESQPNQKGE